MSAELTAKLRKAARAIAATSPAVLVRLLRAGPRDALARAAAAYDAIAPLESHRPAGPDALSLIPTVPLADRLTGHPMVTLEGTHGYIDGSLPIADVLALLSLLRDRSPDVVLEIGTFHGATTRYMAINQPSAIIHTVDLPECYDPANDAVALPKDDFHLIQSRRVGALYRADPTIANVRQHFADTALWDFAPARDASFFFIDGAHTYEYVRNDTLKCLELAGDRKVTVLWHDCNGEHPAVVQWLTELIRDGGDVVRIAGTNLALMG